MAADSKSGRGGNGAAAAPQRPPAWQRAAALFRRLTTGERREQNTGLRLPGAVWAPELQEGKKGWHHWVAAVVESLVWEILVSLSLLVDLTITFASLFMESEGFTVYVIGAALFTILLADNLLRMVKEGVRFVYRPLNCVETSVTAFSAVVITFDGIRRAACDEADECPSLSGAKAAVFGRFFRPMLQISRVLRLAVRVWRGHAMLKAQTDRLWQRLVYNRLVQFLLLPPGNITVKPSAGLIHIEKAQFRSSALEGVHLPLTISCGIADMIHSELVSVPQAARRGGDSDKPVAAAAAGTEEEPPSPSGSGRTPPVEEEEAHRVLVVVENVLVVFGPGHHQEPPAPLWDFDRVMAHQKMLIELLARVVPIMANAKQPGQAGDTSASKNPPGLPNDPSAASVNSTGGSSRAEQFVRRRAMAHLEAILAGGVYIRVRNFEVRYEDALGRRPPWPVEVARDHTLVAGLRVGSLDLRVRSVGQGDAHQNGPEDEEEQGGFRSRGRWNTGSKQVVAVVKPVPKRLVQVMRCALDLRCAGAYWDLHPTDGQAQLDAALASRYTEKLQQGSMEPISAFLEENARRQLRERLRVVACNEVERRLGQASARHLARLEALWTQKRWSPPLARRRSAAAGCPTATERARRLRERLFLHRYLVLPFDASVHALVRVGGDVPGEAKEPQVDLNVLVPTISAACDLAQAASAARMFAYFRRWIRENWRFQWKPPPAHLGGARARTRWWYALQRILCEIDPLWPWRSLMWIDLQRRAQLRLEYLEVLSIDRPYRDEDRVAVLQVGLPLLDVMKVRTQAAALRTMVLKTGRRNRLSVLCRFLCAGRCFGGGPDDARQGDVAESPDAVLLQLGEETAPAQNVRRPGVLSKLDLAVQLRLHVVRVHAGLLSNAEAGARRQLFRAEVNSTAITGTVGAPLSVALRLAPPEGAAAVASAAAAASGKSKLLAGWEDSPALAKLVLGAAQVLVHDVRVTFCAAPTSAPWLRRLCGLGSVAASGLPFGDGAPPVAPAPPAVASAPPVSSSQGQQPMLYSESSDTVTAAAGEASRGEVALRLQVALLAPQAAELAGRGKDSPQNGPAGASKDKKPPFRLFFATHVAALEVRVCLPVLRALKRTILPPRIRVRRLVATQGEARAQSSAPPGTSEPKKDAREAPPDAAAASAKRPLSRSKSQSHVAQAQAPLPPSPMASPMAKRLGIDVAGMLSDIVLRRSTSTSSATEAVTANESYEDSGLRPPDPASLLLDLQHLIEARQEERWVMFDRRKAEERLIGLDGPLAGLTVTGSVHLLGGARTVLMEPNSPKDWLAATARWPAGILATNTGGGQPTFQGGFVTLGPAGADASPSTVAGAFRPPLRGGTGLAEPPEGWWFAPSQPDVHERRRSAWASRTLWHEGGVARNGRSMSPLGRAGSPKGQAADDFSNAGPDAHELPQQERLSPTRDHRTLFGGHRPRMSSRGLSPTHPSTPRRNNGCKDLLRPPVCCGSDIDKPNSIQLRARESPRSLTPRSFRAPPTPLAAAHPHPGRGMLNTADAAAVARALAPDIEFTLEVPSMGALGLPGPLIAEELWVAMGCAAGSQPAKAGVVAA